MTCKYCRLEWQGLPASTVCMRCQSQGPRRPTPDADTEPMPSADIESIKVQMRQAGWEWRKQ